MKHRQNLHFQDDLRHARPMASRARRSSIPAFALYGEAGGAAVEMLHVEPIQSRSRLYRWEIDAHTHHALHQIVWVASGPAQVVLDDAQEACLGPVAIVIPPGVVHTCLLYTSD